MYRGPLHTWLVLLLSTLLFSHLALSQNVSWTQTRGPSGGNITALAVTPAGTVLAGTDEGVHRSTDGGLSWKWASATMTYRRISALEQDSSGAMIAGTSEGKIYTSSDDGLSWQEIPGQGSASITALCSGDSAALWVSRWNTGVSRTTDGGMHWQTLDSGLTDKFVLSLLVGDSGFALAGTMTGIFRTTGSVVSWTPAANGPSNSPVYSLAQHPGGNLFAATPTGIFRSTNRGDDWTEADNASARSIVIDDSGTIIAGTFSGDARRSTDGGTLWSPASVSPGLGVSAMALSHSGLVYAGSLGMGVYRSTDSGITWVPRHDGLVASTVLALLRAPDNSVYAATDGSGLFRTTDGATSWVPVPTAPGIFNFYCLATDDSGKILAGTWGNGLLRQSGPGPAWQSIAYGYFYCIATSPGGVILAGNDVGKIIHSTDYGQTWSADSVGTEPVLSVADGGDGYLYAGTFQTGVYRSSDGGKIWSQKNSALSNLIVRTLLTRQGGVLFAGTDGGLFKTSDRGESWTPVTTGLLSLRTMLPIGVNWIVAAGWKGLSLSSNAGNSWSLSNDGLWPPDVRSVAGDATGYLYAGTANAGVFRSVAPTAIGVEGRPRVPVAYSLEQNYPNPFNPTTTIKYGLPNTSRARLTVYDILGREVSVLVNERREAGLHEVTFDGSNLASGVYFYRLQAGDFVSTKRMLVLR